jgi:hypothetical protein
MLLMQSRPNEAPHDPPVVPALPCGRVLRAGAHGVDSVSRAPVTRGVLPFVEPPQQDRLPWRAAAPVIAALSVMAWLLLLIAMRGLV